MDIPGEMCAVVYFAICADHYTSTLANCKDLHKSVLTMFQCSASLPQVYLKSEHQQLKLQALLHTCVLSKVQLEHPVVHLKSMPRQQRFAGSCDARKSCGRESAPYQARGWISSPRRAS